MKSTMTKVAAVAILAVSANAAQAVALNNGDVLTITSGTTSSASFGGFGSFFGMDTNSNEKIFGSEATAIIGGTGYTIGATTPDASTSAIDSWYFNSGYGENYVKGTPITGSTEAGLNMTGLTVFWGGLDIPMGYSAWQVNPTNPTTNNIMEYTGPYTSSTAVFQWSGIYGDTYTLDYTATVPLLAPFGGTQYYLHLEGTVMQAVPEASTYGMMLAGLGLVGFAARRRKTVS